MLNKIADFYEEEVDAAVAGLTSLIEPMMMVFLGVVVGGLIDRDVPADLQAGLGDQPVGDGFGSTDLDPQALRTRLRVWQFARVTIVTVFLGALAASDFSEPKVELPSAPSRC